MSHDKGLRRLMNGDLLLRKLKKYIPTLSRSRLTLQSVPLLYSVNKEHRVMKLRPFFNISLSYKWLDGLKMNTKPLMKNN